MCKNVSYVQEEAGLEVHQYWPLVEIKCSDDLKFFICSLYVPICMEDYPDGTVPPCRLPLTSKHLPLQAYTSCCHGNNILQLHPAQELKSLHPLSFLCLTQVRMRASQGRMRAGHDSVRLLLAGAHGLRPVPQVREALDLHGREGRGVA